MYVGRKERKKEIEKGEKDIKAELKEVGVRKVEKKKSNSKYSKRGISTLLQNHIQVGRWMPMGLEGAL